MAPILPSQLEQPQESTTLIQTPESNSALRKWLVTLAAAAALTGLAPQVGAQAPSSQSTSATLQPTKDYWQITQSGKKFVDLTESEVDGLSRQEKKLYYAWKNAQLDATVNQINTRLEIKYEANNQNNAQVAEMARKNFPVYMATVHWWWDLKGMPESTKQLIRYVAQYKIPPELAKDAQYLLSYI